jgi:hypothetical protein
MVVAAAASAFGPRSHSSRSAAETAARSWSTSERASSTEFRFSDTKERMRARVGKTTDDQDGFFPKMPTTRGRGSLAAERSAAAATANAPPLPRRGVPRFRRRSASFRWPRSRRGAQTRAGVRVGDGLELVRIRYGRVHCGEAVAGEPLFGGELPTYPWRRALVGDVRVFFGGEPIDSVTLTRYAS